ncbi:anion transporter [Acidiphilium sp.]|uniref:anion transporter n=1 Tax=Acidiphilium sp. TaxID=527 RepID=UPI0025895FF4|nr:anion transporter [Acidiphilium sp.]
MHGDLFGSWQPAATVAIFALTYAGVALGRLPFFRLDRAGIAFVGAVLMVASGALTLRQAVAAIDFDTIALLLGMMILAAALRRAGFFERITGAVLSRASGTDALLALTVAMAGLLSAVLVNDTVCVVLTPLVLEACRAGRKQPLPYLVALATASNVGSVATITGNPQNMIIGSLSGIGYAAFAGALVPVALLGLPIVFLVIRLLHRAGFEALTAPAASAARRRPHGGLIGKSVVLLVLFVIACLGGMRPAEAALVAAALIMLTPGVKSQRLLAGVDWSLLLMFAGLFVVVAALQREVIGAAVIGRVAALHPGRPAVLVPLTAILSNLVSNVPAVLVLRPFIAHLADPRQAWLIVAMASTLAGNLTLPGSVANLIVAERARAAGVRIGFGDYLKFGLPITVLTIALGTAWLVGLG